MKLNYTFLNISTKRKIYNCPWKSNFMELGGNIELINFENLEPAKLIVVKKFVGTYAKKLSECHVGFKKLEVTLNPNSAYEIKAISYGLQDHGIIVKGPNLFFVLDKALSELLKKVK
jgi:hypothetical protein